MHEEERPRWGEDEDEEGYIEMPFEPASVDLATTRTEVAWIDYTSAVDKADAAAAAAFDAHVQAGAVDAARVVAADVHSKLQAAATEAHDRAADLKAAAKTASRAVDDALRAELEARDAYTKAIAEGDDAAIEAAWNAVKNLTTLTDAHKATRESLRAAAESAADSAAQVDALEDAAVEVAGPLAQADVRAEMAVDAYEAAHAEAGRAADATREAYNQAVDAEKAVEAYNQAIDAEKAVRQDAAKAAADTGSSVWGTDEDAAGDAPRAVDEDAGDVEHIEMPPEPAREQAEPPGSRAAPIERDASSRLMDGGGRGASPIEDLRDEAFSGEEEEEEGEGAPDAAAADATVGGVAVGAAGDRFSIGDTIKDVSEPILGPLADAGDAVEDETTNVYTDSDGKLWVDGDDYNRTVGEYNDLLEHTESQQQVEAYADAAEDMGESVEDFVGGIPLIGEDLGDALRDGYDVVEDGVDHMDDPVEDVVDPWG